MIKLHNKLFSWLSTYIKYSFHVAASATALLWVTHRDFNQPIGFWSSIWFFTVVVFGYNFLKQNTASIERLRWFAAFAVPLVLFLWLLLITKDSRPLLIAFVSFLLVLFYHKNRFQPWVAFRIYPWIKIVVIAFVWTCLSLIFIAPQKAFFEIYALERFMWIVVWLIPFELRDVYLEKAHRTNQPILDVGVLKVLGIGLIIGILLINYSVPSLHRNQDVFGFILFLLVLGIFFSNSSRSAWYSLFWLEAIPILWCLLYVLMRM
ncbi:MAG: hypothetical protein RQ756_05065 [Flavobacteriaceae bacterium]|nr:hypothetical protein [Flavobacteriaceae bacterium]